jgi:hypothetical protein
VKAQITQTDGGSAAEIPNKGKITRFHAEYKYQVMEKVESLRQKKFNKPYKVNSRNCITINSRERSRQDHLRISSMMNCKGMIVATIATAERMVKFFEATSFL